MRTVYYSRVDIALINEQVRFFYSTLDKVKIEINSNTFQIKEFINLEFNGVQKLYPLENTLISFSNRGTYSIHSEILFDPPQFDLGHLYHIHNHNKTILDKFLNEVKIEDSDLKDLLMFPNTCLICFINGIEEAKGLLISARDILKNRADKQAYIALKESLRIIRKLNYK